eukprot:c23985_g1_i1 orf=612-1343(-)
MEVVHARSPASRGPFVARLARKRFSCSSAVFSGLFPTFPLLGVSLQSQRSRGALVVQARKGKRRYMPPQRSEPVIPKFDNDDDPKFVLFVRDHKVPIWFPLSVVAGGTLAKMMVTARETQLGRMLSGDGLTRSIGTTVYKDERSIRMRAVKTYSVLKTATNLEYGYKIVDKANPKSAFSTSNITKIPPQEELKPFVEKIKDFFGQSITDFKDSFGSRTSVNYGTEKSSSVPENDEKLKLKKPR